MGEVILYHPWIEPSNAQMLCTAALIWDRMLTIVPHRMEQPYSNPVALEAYEAGFLRARRVSPDMPEVQRASDEFAADLRRRAVRKTARTRGVRLHHDKFSPPRREATTRIHSDKLALRLHPGIFEGPLDEEGFALVQQGIGTAYMSKLASIVAAEDQVEPFTDSSTHYDVVLDRFAEPTSGMRERETIYELARVSCRTVGVRDDIPIHTIIEFRQANRDLLTGYRSALEQLRKQLAVSHDSPDEIGPSLAEIVRERIAPRVDELESKLRERNLLAGLSYLDLTQSCSMGLLASGFDKWEFGMLGGLVSLGINLYRNRRQTEAELRDSPFGYLFKARGRFSKETRDIRYGC